MSLKYVDFIYKKTVLKFKKIIYNSVLRSIRLQQNLHAVYTAVLTYEIPENFIYISIIENG